MKEWRLNLTEEDIRNRNIVAVHEIGHVLYAHFAARLWVRDAWIYPDCERGEFRVWVFSHIWNDLMGRDWKRLWCGTLFAGPILQQMAYPGSGVSEYDFKQIAAHPDMMILGAQDDVNAFFKEHLKELGPLFLDLCTELDWDGYLSGSKIRSIIKKSGVRIARK